MGHDHALKYVDQYDEIDQLTQHLPNVQIKILCRKKKQLILKYIKKIQKNLPSVARVFNLRSATRSSFSYFRRIVEFQ